MIFYLSGTGNSKWAAQKLARFTQETLYAIPEIIDGDCNFALKTDERIGFVFPVHGWRPPKIVRTFMQKLQLRATHLEQHFCYLLCTAGNDVGLTMDYAQKDLEKVGLHVQAMFSLLMPNTYVGLPFMDVDSRATMLRKKHEAEKALRDYAKAILDCKRGEVHLHLSKWPRINSYFLGKVFANYFITDSPFHVDVKRCVACGICKMVCPVDDIVGGFRQKPAWKHNERCLACFACYHHCPQHAIDYGWMTRRKGQYYFK